MLVLVGWSGHRDVTERKPRVAAETREWLFEPESKKTKILFTFVQ